MKKLLLTTLCFCCSMALFGQTPNIEEQVRAYENSKSELISKARRMLLDMFVEGNVDNMDDIVSYVEGSLEDEDYLGLYDGEKMLIHFWTGNYPAVIKLMQDIANSPSYSPNQIFNTNKQASQQKIYPSEDLLSPKLQAKTADSFDELCRKIEQTDASKEDKDFLILTLDYLISSFIETGYDSKILAQEALNSKANHFIDSYPSSSYLNAVKNIIRYELENGKWSRGYGVFGGYSALSGALASTYSSSGVIGVTLELSYKKIAAIGNFFTASLTNSKDLTYGSSEVWPKGESASILGAGLFLGYNIFDKKICKIVPHIGVSYFEISPSSSAIDDNPALNELRVRTASFSLGTNIDFKIKRRMILGAESGYYVIRVGYTCHFPHFTSSHFNPSGTLHCFTLGIGIWNRNIAIKK